MMHKTGRKETEEKEEEKHIVFFSSSHVYVVFSQDVY